jgi:hypothetical protein
VDAVGPQAVEGAVLPPVLDHGAGRLQDGFGALDGIPGLFPALHRRQAVDLLGVEDGGEEHSRPFQPHFRFDRLALGIEDGLADLVGAEVFLAELPVLDGRTVLALAHLRAGSDGLFVGQPALIDAALAHQLDGVDAAIALAGGRVDREQGSRLARFPRPLPGRGALPQLLDQLLGHLFVKCFFGVGHRPYLLAAAVVVTAGAVASTRSMSLSTASCSLKASSTKAPACSASSGSNSA